ncbi:MAG: NF038122 family metalloprotease [Verrucomicrobiota bacterium]
MSLSSIGRIGCLLAALSVDLAATPLSIDESAHLSLTSAGSTGGSGGFTIDEGSGLPLNLGSFDIVINPGATLAANQPAVDAFNRAAARWEQFFSDPITVNIDADLMSFGSTTILGSASSVILQGDFDAIRNAMVFDSATDFNDGIVSALPTFAQFTGSLPTGFSFDSNISINKANAKALGFTGLDTTFGATDATISFNTDLNFDFDNSDGVPFGQFDFETVALHEIGHALGFTSEVDRIDVLLSQSATAADISPRTVDLFRFEDGTPNDPSTAAEFTTAERFLQTGGTAIFDEIIEIGIDGAEGLLSTGANTGNGAQASHWLETFPQIGILDPFISPGQIGEITPADVRALDLIGYDFIPEPGISGLLLAALGLVFRRNRGISR